jgi:type IV pilus assembly protein PilN
MIRINLLPQKRRTEATPDGQAWLIVLLVAVLAEVAALFIIHSVKTDEFATQKRRNAEVEARIQSTKQAVKDHDAVKEQLKTLRAREDAISKLQSARSGPTAVLLELARILTTGRGPSASPEVLDRLRRENPLALYNPGWDARRLWLTKFVETQRRVRLEGFARDGEDVSEFARRMNLSGYFEDVRLLPASKMVDTKTKLEVIKFELEARVKY